MREVWTVGAVMMLDKERDEEVKRRSFRGNESSVDSLRPGDRCRVAGRSAVTLSASSSSRAWCFLKEEEEDVGGVG